MRILHASKESQAGRKMQALILADWAIPQSASQDGWTENPVYASLLKQLQVNVGCKHVLPGPHLGGSSLLSLHVQLFNSGPLR